MLKSIKAGVAYFGGVFVVGFAFGILRVTLLIPRIGELRAVALEVPVILVVSWNLCGWALRRFTVPRGMTVRLIMGGVAFGLLMIGEAVLAFVAGRTPGAYLASFATAPGALGLAAQLAFALFPLGRPPRWPRTHRERAAHG